MNVIGVIDVDLLASSMSAHDGLWSSDSQGLKLHVQCLLMEMMGDINVMYIGDDDRGEEEVRCVWWWEGASEEYNRFSLLLLCRYATPAADCCLRRGIRLSSREQERESEVYG